jgi:hypothetical protein
MLKFKKFPHLFLETGPKLPKKFPTTQKKAWPTAGENNNNVKNQSLIGGANNQLDGQLVSVTDNDNLNYDPYIPEVLWDIPPLAAGATLETVMAALVNAINRQVQIIQE